MTIDLLTLTLSFHSSSILFPPSLTGGLWSWGECEHGKLGLGNTSEKSMNSPQQLKDDVKNVKMVRVKCGPNVSMAWTSEGKLYSWSV